MSVTFAFSSFLNPPKIFIPWALYTQHDVRYSMCELYIHIMYTAVRFYNNSHRLGEKKTVKVEKVDFIFQKTIF